MTRLVPAVASPACLVLLVDKFVGQSVSPLHSWLKVLAMNLPDLQRLEIWMSVPSQATIFNFLGMVFDSTGQHPFPSLERLDLKNGCINQLPTSAMPPGTVLGFGYWEEDRWEPYELVDEEPISRSQCLYEGLQKVGIRFCICSWRWVGFIRSFCEI